MHLGMFEKAQTFPGPASKKSMPRQEPHDRLPEPFGVVQVGGVRRPGNLHYLGVRHGFRHLLCSLVAENATFGSPDDKSGATDSRQMPQKIVVVEPGKDLPVIGPVPAALPLNEGVGDKILK